MTDPNQIQIDHMVPLKNAHASGAWAWSRERRREYANDLRYRWHLIAVLKSANESKGDKGPDKWRPENRQLWCQYAQAWAAVKTVYQLRTTAAERAALREILDVLFDEQELARIAAWAMKEAGVDRKGLVKREAELKRWKANLALRRERLLDALESGQIAPAVLNKRLARRSIRSRPG